METEPARPGEGMSKAAVAHPEVPTFFALKSFETHLMRDVVSGGWVLPYPGLRSKTVPVSKQANKRTLFIVGRN